MIDWAMYLLMGAAMGTLGGVFGIGGGLIAIPALVLMFGMDQQLAQGTTLVMVVPNVMLSLWRYHQRTRIFMRHALPLAAAGFVFAWIGSIIAVGLDPDAMRIGFAIFMLVLATYVYLQMYLRKPPPSTELRHPWPWLMVLGSGSGILGGLFGLGASVLATPILSTVFGATQVVAQGLSLALAVPSTGVTLVTYALHNHIDWHIGIPMALGGLLSVSWGVRLAHALPEKSLRTWFCLFLVLCAALMIFKA
ncbi:hypothetical protein B1219_18505 [Pseudomonas ogarae]|uniref:sulfite exporter TauE/SafE family protein n=1 Tax=Pseudomonas ogarae (strain DSM 112162 / CECT 30235 / F113) TaxID=1114970 RepID=UPI0009A26D27|nr:sulfite exporter TauE/SafE family protein [Pseudomonas ogarae]OPG72146.1 hypothetical protein B1219_18505 [Pseudomonas ogarae]